MEPYERLGVDLPHEPPERSIVMDRDGIAWQRFDSSRSTVLSPYYLSARMSYGYASNGDRIPLWSSL